jgi:hypothetical protein
VREQAKEIPQLGIRQAISHECHWLGKPLEQQLMRGRLPVSFSPDEQPGFMGLSEKRQGK